MTDKTGGSAFPIPATELHGTATGMNLRDYLAAKAMNAMISTIPLPWSLREQCEGDFYNTAQSAYKMADAMLKARG